MRNLGSYFMGMAGLLTLLAGGTACFSVAHLDTWERELTGLCSFSSPRPVDLNGDGVLDIVIGSGRDEFQPTDSAVIAFDGRNGNVLWHVAGWDQMVGSPVFIAIDDDAVSDVILGGRAGQLYAMSGATGKILWQPFYASDLEAAYAKGTNLLNFYTPQLIPDQNGDGRQDILVAYGGDARIHRDDPNRPVGQLWVISSRDGQVLRRVDMPDSAETYMSALCVDLESKGEWTVLFGTGGETFPGSFYRVPLSGVLDGSLAGIRRLATSPGRGFMAPPVLADINGDNILDIIVNAVDGRMLALDGKDDALRWQVQIPGAEVYSSIAVGNFTGDPTPDFFTNFGVGIFPDVVATIQLMVDGQTGKIAFQDSLGYLQIGSPLAIDFNGDGYDEAVMTVNELQKDMAKDHFKSLYGTSNKLLAFDFQADRIYTLLGPFKGVNPAATPWIGDLDGDKQLDLIYSYMRDTLTYKPFHGMKIHRREFDFRVEDHIKWGSYMGTWYNGVAAP